MFRPTPNNSRNTTSKTDEKGTYRDFLGFRLSFGTYTEEFSSNSKTVSVVTTNTEDHASNGEIDYEEEYDVTLNSNSHDRKVKGAYSPIGGSEEVEKDHRKTHTLAATATTRPKDYVDPFFYNITEEHSERTDIDVSLDKATGTSSVRDFIVSYVPSSEESIEQSSNGTVVTDLYENSASPKKPGKVDTGGGGGGVFAFAAGAAGTVAVDVIDPTGAIQGAAGALGTLALVAETGLGKSFGDGHKDPNSAGALAKELGMHPGFRKGSHRHNIGKELGGNTAAGVEAGLSVLPGSTAFEAGQLIHGQDITGKKATGWTVAGILAGIFGAKKLGGAADEVADATTDTAKAGDRFQAARKGAKLTGQIHHVMSTKVVRAIDNHPVLKGLFKKRDNRFVTQAVDGAAHCGYQRWHRDLDDEVVRWIVENPNKNGDDFLAYLQELYKRPDLAERFPNGF